MKLCLLVALLLIGCGTISGIAAGGEGVKSAGEGIKVVGDSAAAWINQVTLLTSGAGAIGLELLRRRAGMWKRMAFSKPKNASEGSKFDGWYAKDQSS